MFDDLREFLDTLQDMGELKVVDGVDWDLELGAIAELMAERKGPALLFDGIRDYPRGYRVAANLITASKRRLRIALGYSDDVSDAEVIRRWKDIYENYRPVSPVEVSDGPVMENVMEGDKVNMLKFPAPKWHEMDGGRYIGTGDMVLTKDPDGGWVNLGVYRVMVHDEHTLSFYVRPGSDGDIIRRKYWERGESCPVVMTFGQDPLTWISSALSLPWGTSELEFAGYLRGEPVRVIRGKYTGLPIPATAEIAIEGEAPPPSEERRLEGPFGEWTGYYASGAREEPVVRVKAVYHRNDPIIWGEPPSRANAAVLPIPIDIVSLVWSALERAGLAGIRGVSGHGWAGVGIIVIAVEQKYPGHAKRVGTMAASLLPGIAATKFVVVVDEDVDPTDLDQVLWAISTRTDPAVDIDVIAGMPTNALEPTVSPEKREKGDLTFGRAVILAVRPYHWRDKFPPVATVSRELRERVLQKWMSLFQGA
ncbi:MAG: UbiD family decarboxylase [Nitrososphaeria archaeon]